VRAGRQKWIHFEKTIPGPTSLSPPSPPRPSSPALPPTMASSLGQFAANALWFAFDGLDVHHSGVVDKARLKELTRQVAEVLGVLRPVEHCLGEYRSTDCLSFEQYLHFLEYEVFTDISRGGAPYSGLARPHAALDALCWEVGRHCLAPRYPAALAAPDTFKVFRVFCLLAERRPVGRDTVQVYLRRSEVSEICKKLVEGLGQDWDPADCELSASINTFPLPVFLTFVEGRYGRNAEPSALSESVEAVYKFFVGQVLFHGKTFQRITRAGGWIRREIEVVPWCIRAVVDSAEEVPDENKKLPPSGKLSSAVGRSLTLGRNAVGAMGGAMKSGVTEVVERSRTLTRGTPSPSKSPNDESDSNTRQTRGFSLGRRWGSISGINKKRDRSKARNASDASSLTNSRVSSPETPRSRTLDRLTTKHEDESFSSSGSPSRSSTAPSPLQKPQKDSTKGVVGGVMGKVWKLDLTNETVVTSLKDAASGRRCRISILSNPTAKPIIIAAQDHRSKTRLMAALEEAIAHCTDDLPYQMLMAAGRRATEDQRDTAEGLERSRRRSQADIIEQTQAELCAERTAREEAETLAATEAEARAAEEGRVAELTELRKQLELMVHQERQAKEDEEIVRNLQSRVLREEWARREELERLQQEQEMLLEEEQRKRKAFEMLQKEQEMKLREAEQRLKSLDGERRRLDEELRAAKEKIVMSGRGKQLLEARMRVQEGRRPPARTLSLRPSRTDRSPARASLDRGPARKTSDSPVRSSSLSTSFGATEALQPDGNDSLETSLKTSSPDSSPKPETKLPTQEEVSSKLENSNGTETTVSNAANEVESAVPVSTSIMDNSNSSENRPTEELSHSEVIPSAEVLTVPKTCGVPESEATVTSSHLDDRDTTTKKSSEKVQIKEEQAPPTGSTVAADDLQHIPPPLKTENSAVVENIVVDAVVENIAVDTVVENIAVDAVVDNIAFDAVVENIPVDTVVEKIAVDTVVGNIVVDAVVETIVAEATAEQPATGPTDPLSGVSSPADEDKVEASKKKSRVEPFIEIETYQESKIDQTSLAVEVIEQTSSGIKPDENGMPPKNSEELEVKPLIKDDLCKNVETEATFGTNSVTYKIGSEVESDDIAPNQNNANVDVS